jgi:hypothetical protein
VRRHLSPALALYVGVLCCNVYAAEPDYLVGMPQTKPCKVMRGDEMQSRIARSEKDPGYIPFFFGEATKEGRNSTLCRAWRARRPTLVTDPFLAAPSNNGDLHEHIMAWTRLCLLDWCDNLLTDPALPKTSATPTTEVKQTGTVPMPARKIPPGLTLPQRKAPLKPKQ